MVGLGERSKWELLFQCILRENNFLFWDDCWFTAVKGNNTEILYILTCAANPMVTTCKCISQLEIWQLMQIKLIQILLGLHAQVYVYVFMSMQFYPR